MDLARSSQHGFYLGEIGRIVVAVKLNPFEVISIAPAFDQKINGWII